MIFQQLFDATSSTYTYVLADEDTRKAVVIDSVFEQMNRDLALLREGLVGLLERDGFEVVAPVGDAESFEHEMEARSPDVCVVDLRLPPAFTDEGLRAAIAIRVCRAAVSQLPLAK